MDPGHLRVTGAAPVCSRFGGLGALSRRRSVAVVSSKCVCERAATRPRECSLARYAGTPPGPVRLLLPGAVVCCARNARSNLSHTLWLHAGLVCPGSTRRGAGGVGLPAARHQAHTPHQRPLDPAPMLHNSERREELQVRPGCTRRPTRRHAHQQLHAGTCPQLCPQLKPGSTVAALAKHGGTAGLTATR